LRDNFPDVLKGLKSAEEVADYEVLPAVEMDATPPEPPAAPVMLTDVHHVEETDTPSPENPNAPDKESRNMFFAWPTPPAPIAGDPGPEPTPAPAKRGRPKKTGTPAPETAPPVPPAPVPPVPPVTSRGVNIGTAPRKPFEIF
jgi:hypothetical protein